MKEANKIPCRRSFTDTLLELAKVDKEIIAVTSDASGSATLTDFAKTLPEQFVEVGIAEQNSVAVSCVCFRDFFRCQSVLVGERPTE